MDPDGNGAGTVTADARARAASEVSAARMRESRRKMEPDEGEPTADRSDLMVTRDPDTGEIEPLRKKTPYNGLVVEFKPLTYRDQMRYGLDDRGLIELNDEERLEFLREHIVEPDLSDLETLEEIRYSVVEDLLLVVAAHSRDKRWAELPRPAGEDSGKD